MKGSGSRIHLRLVQAVLVLTLAAGSLVQYDVGLADNGDFTRLMTWLTSGPTGFPENWPPEGSPGYEQRFFHYTLPYWHLDMPLNSRWVSSILLLWAPGALVNMAAYSSDVLYLPNLSIIPRFLTVLFLVLLLQYVEKHSPSVLLHTLLLCVPWVLVWANTDMVAYFNSFYQEPASFASLFLLLSFLVLLRRREASVRVLLPLVLAVLLMVSAKISNIYWSVLVAAFAVPFSLWRRRRGMVVLYASGLLVLPLVFSLLQANLVGSRFDNAYQSIFCGALAFSTEADSHLERLGLQAYRANIDVPAYTAAGRTCIEEQRELMRHTTTMGMILREPLIAWRMLVFAADSMQRLELAHLGKEILVRDYGEVHTIMPWVLRGEGQPVFRVWTAIKARLFPRGVALLGVMLVLAVIFLVGMRHPAPFVSDLARIGLLCILAAATDMWIEIFGDGKRDLIKHLVLPNLLFDMALALGLLVLASFLPARDRRPQELAVPAVEAS